MAPQLPLDLPTGVEYHGNAIRISFSYRGKRYRESLGLELNKQNVKFASTKREAIMYEIRIGTFNYASHFPDSKHAFGLPSNKSIAELARAFIDSKSHNVRRSTLRRYDNTMEEFCEMYGGSRTCETLSPRSLMQFRALMVKDRGSRTINRNLVTINAFLSWLHKMEYTPKDLSNVLERVKESEPDIRPFSIEEVMKAINTSFHLQHRNIFTLFVYTGLRTSELCALAWEDVDFEKRTIHIRRSAYCDRGLKTTKTDKERFVDLMPPALDALKSQRLLTEHLPIREYDIELPSNAVRKEKLHFVFNPKVVRIQKGSDHDYYSGRSLGKIWEKMCAAAGVEYRNQYQLRHTYASWLITHANVNVSYLAQQMGHADITMVARIYGKWLMESNKKESDRAWRELEKAMMEQ